MHDNLEVRQDRSAGELDRLERRYQQLVQGLDAIVWEAEAESLAFTFVSDRAEELLGYPVERWLAEPDLFAKMLHPDDRAEALTRSRSATAAGLDYEADFRMIAADGRTLWFHQVVRVISDAFGTPREVRGVMLDVTRLRESVETVRVQAELLDEISAAVCAVDPRGVVLYWNRQAEDLFGWSRGEAIGTGIVELGLVAGDADEAVEVRDALLAGKRWEGEVTARHRDGSEVSLYLRGSGVRGPADEVSVLLGIAIEIADRRHSDRLHLPERVLDAVDVAVIATDRDGRVVRWNAKARELYGWSSDEATGARLVDLLAGDPWRDAVAAAVGGGEGEAWEGDLIVRAKGGEEVAVWVRETPVRDERGELLGHVAASLELPAASAGAHSLGRSPRGDSRSDLIGVVPLGDAKLRAEAVIAERANRDRLTGLASRRLLRDHLQLSIPRARRRGTALALLHVAIERFALVADALGRARAEELVRAVGARLDALEGADAVARDAGGEFLIAAEVEPASRDVQDGGGSAVAQVLAGAVVDAFAEPFQAGGERVPLGANVGISLLPVDAHDADTMLEHAEAAVREARGSRGGIVTYRARGGDARARLSLATSLRGALDRDEFQLHYQPIVDLRRAWDSRRGSVTDLPAATVAAEALIRWRHPQHGLVAPGQFLPMLDDNGLTHRVGSWLVEEVCRQVSDWRALGLRFDTAFNISLRELAEPGLVERLVEQTDRAGVDRRSLVAEITETAAVADPDRIGQVLDDLADAGFQLAIDDFGTGHSSLARLWRMPVRTLKIDRSFTAALLSDPAARTIVTTIVRMAEGLGIRTLAEGIETEEQLRFLVTHGCNLGQGYLFSRPVRASELTRICSRR